MNTYHGKKTHSCHKCGYSSFKASYLKAHMLVHSGVKPFVCKKCSFSCTQAGDLKTHMLNHSGEKPFSSQKFEFSCTTVSYLKKHMLTHSGEKPFWCDQLFMRSSLCSQEPQAHPHCRTAICMLAVQLLFQ